MNARHFEDRRATQSSETPQSDARVLADGARSGVGAHVAACGRPIAYRQNSRPLPTDSFCCDLAFGWEKVPRLFDAPGPCLHFRV
jgi:hypothetical protein